jgi:tRNA dimethylallyltransferase
VTESSVIPILVGPTGTGKTERALHWAKTVGGEIISADSRQVYRRLRIGTGKPPGAWTDRAGRRVYLVEGVPHFLMDQLDPTDVYSAGRFAADADAVLAAPGGPRMIVGGTGLYVKALVDGLAPLPPRNEALRHALMERAEREGRAALHAELERVDPAAAAKIPANNIARLLRALEVFQITGRPISVWQRESTHPSPRRFRWFGLRWDRDALRRRLEERCRRWLAEGMIEETRALLDDGVPPEAPAFAGVGYPLVIDHLAGRLSRAELEEKFLQATLRYVKRQNTWFRADPRIAWIDVDPASDVNDLSKYFADHSGA